MIRQHKCLFLLDVEGGNPQLYCIGWGASQIRLYRRGTWGRAAMKLLMTNDVNLRATLLIVLRRFSCLEALACYLLFERAMRSFQKDP